MKASFLDLTIRCASVICCRSSPKQKALVCFHTLSLICLKITSFDLDSWCQVTRLVKTGTRKTTLAIGDGANDVGMLQEADIGVGISGAEGMQVLKKADNT